MGQPAAQISYVCRHPYHIILEYQEKQFCLVKTSLPGIKHLPSLAILKRSIQPLAQFHVILEARRPMLATRVFHAVIGRKAPLVEEFPIELLFAHMLTIWIKLHIVQTEALHVAEGLQDEGAPLVHRSDNARLS